MTFIAYVSAYLIGAFGLAVLIGKGIKHSSGMSQAESDAEQWAALQERDHGTDKMEFLPQAHPAE